MVLISVIYLETKWNNCIYFPIVEIFTKNYFRLKVILVETAAA
jgi:hypothetical protein